MQGGDGSGMEEHFPVDNGKPQIGDAFDGSSGLGADAQSLVAIHNRYSVNFTGGGRSLEQAKKAIGGASFRRIRMVDPGKKASGSEGYGNSFNGESPDAEAYPSHCSNREERCVDMLPGGGSGNIEAHDDMETEVESFNGVVKEARMEHDRSCNNES